MKISRGDINIRRREEILSSSHTVWTHTQACRERQNTHTHTPKVSTGKMSLHLVSHPAVLPPRAAWSRGQPRLQAQGPSMCPPSVLARDMGREQCVQ